MKKGQVYYIESIDNIVVILRTFTSVLGEKCVCLGHKDWSVNLSVEEIELYSKPFNLIGTTELTHSQKGYGSI